MVRRNPPGTKCGRCLEADATPFGVYCYICACIIKRQAGSKSWSEGADFSSEEIEAQIRQGDIDAGWPVGPLEASV